MASIVVTHICIAQEMRPSGVAHRGKVVTEGDFEELQKSDIEFVKEFLNHSEGGIYVATARLGASLL